MTWQRPSVRVGKQQAPAQPEQSRLTTTQWVAVAPSWQTTLQHRVPASRPCCASCTPGTKFTPQCGTAGFAWCTQGDPAGFTSTSGGIPIAPVSSTRTRGGGSTLVKVKTGCTLSWEENVPPFAWVPDRQRLALVGDPTG
jgi:hypothetical protein